MSTLIVPTRSIDTLVQALKGYHYPRQGFVFDTESLRQHIPLFVRMVSLRRLPGGLCAFEGEAAQIHDLLTHMRLRGLTRSSAVMHAATDLGISLSVFEEAATG